MSITEWSEHILIVELADEPAFSEDMDSLMVRLDTPADAGGVPDVILDMKAVTHLNSSNLSQLLRLRKQMQLAGGGSTRGRLRICAANDQIWSVMLITGLDGLFEFTEDVSTSLASLQMERS